jgi:predicted transcriptional regulator of viral defense system
MLVRDTPIFSAGISLTIIKPQVAMGVQAFFEKHPVFRHGEFVAFYEAKRSRSRKTRESLLAHHVRRGRLLRVRRGLYAVLPRGADPKRYRPDPYLLAARMTDDAVLAYHTALEFRGRAYSVFEQFQYLTARATRPATFRGYRFRPVRFPKALRDESREDFGVERAERAGLDIRVTSLERALVDVLDRPDLGGGWEEIWRSLESVEFFYVDQVVEYALLLDNATTVAKVGFFLEHHRDALMVREEHLAALERHRPKKPHYVHGGRTDGGRFVAKWNLVVPVALLERSWQEVV